MRIFHCDHCGQAIFFENTICGRCGHKLAYVPQAGALVSLDPASGRSSEVGGPLPSLWTVAGDESRTYRLCGNYVNHNVCNWAIPAQQPDLLCASCRLTRVIPDLTKEQNRELWCRMEIAKRRLVYSLLSFKLPVEPKSDKNPRGLEFRFVGDPGSGPRVLTGHDNGVITVNISEADDVEREKARISMHEPYRTLLGHFRHESGHYYWDRLIKDTPNVDRFRQQFGDERPDYNQSLQAYYQRGPRLDWQQHFVTAYASVHPWEDWAETWAHYLHMTDTLETAAVCGLSLQPDHPDEPAMKKPKVQEASEIAFDDLIADWLALTYVLNNLNRGMGLPDAYPFVLPPATIEKIRFVHDLVHGGEAPGQPQSGPSQEAPSQPVQMEAVGAAN
jgi:hypothetical protein